jgi:hypothetical protein
MFSVIKFHRIMLFLEPIFKLTSTPFANDILIIRILPDPDPQHYYQVPVYPKLR